MPRLTVRHVTQWNICAFVNAHACATFKANINAIFRVERMFAVNDGIRCKFDSSAFARIAFVWWLQL